MNYWLSPQGQVWESENVGFHFDIALDIIKQKYPKYLNRFGWYDCFNNGNPVYFLEDRNYIRYMDWDNPRWIIRPSKTPTKIQIRKMFDLTQFIYK